MATDEDTLNSEILEKNDEELDDVKSENDELDGKREEIKNGLKDDNDKDQCENGKKKPKDEKPPTKVVIRRLPPTMTEDNFVEQVSPIPPYDYLYFVQGDMANGIFSFSRVYINFINQEDLYSFTQTFDGYVFFDSKGQEYPAIVEFALFQRIPKRVKKKDKMCGTIECDPSYIAFKENLEAEALENSKSGSTVQQHFFETEISTAQEISTTPLLEFLKQKRAEKARVKDERREEKKRKDSERRMMKQKIKDKKTDVEEEETKEIKPQVSYMYGKSDKDEAKNKIENKINGRETLTSVKSDSILFKPIIAKKETPSIKKEEKNSETEKTNAKRDLIDNQKAEKQSLYLQKLLGICTSEKKSQEIKNEKNKILIAQTTNVNPSLPSASFKSSHKVSKKSKNEFKEVRELEKKSVIISNPALVDPSIVSLSEGKNLKGEVIIDKALSTNNLLPSAFKKLPNKSS